MKIHHLNCGTMCPALGRWFNATGDSALGRGRMVCHCLLVETERGLVLVDTGIGTGDIEHPKRLGRLFDMGGKPRYDHAETAVAQVRALGFDPEDVRHIVCTHLDLDHAGGLPDFPKAAVHAHEDEIAMATFDRGRNSKMRYLPRQWAHGPDWHRYRPDGEEWFGFAAVRELAGLEGVEIALVPLVGHSRGHSAVAVREGDRWLMHCGDAYMVQDEVDERRAVPTGVKLFARLTEFDRSARVHNLQRLRELHAGASDDVTLFCAHDPHTFEELAETA